jgi:NodT family efflux transporter outer membrane factor (OMF) lipoprotein
MRTFFSRQFVIVALFGLTLMVGCSPHTRITVEHDLSLPETFATTQKQADVRITGLSWWEAFADPDLNRLISEALTANLDLEQAAARLQQSEALLKSATSGRYPTLSFAGDASQGSQPTAAGDRQGGNSSLSVAAAFELDLWGQNAARSRSAKFGYQAAQQELESFQLSLAARVADAYFLLIEKRAQRQLVEQSIAAYSQSLEMVERRYRNGLVPAVDLHQARQNLANAQANREATESAMQLAEHALAVLIGRYPAEDVAGELVVLPSPPVAFPAGLPSELLTRRPDLRAALLRVQANDEQLAVAIADRFPKINLLGSYGQSRNTFSVPSISGEFWNLAAGLTLPLIDGGRRRAEVERQQALLAESLAGYRQTVLVAFQEVEDALTRNATIERRIDYLVTAEQAAADALRLSIERYRYGLSEYLQVVTAQVFHFQIQGNLIAARRQMLSDRISLARALGGEWPMPDENETLNSDEEDQI